MAKRVAGVRHVFDDLEVDQEEIGCQSCGRGGLAERAQSKPMWEVPDTLF